MCEDDENIDHIKFMCAVPGIHQSDCIETLDIGETTTAKSKGVHQSDCIETLDIGETATAKSKGHNFILFVNDNPGYDFFLRQGLQQVQIIRFVELVI
ncbi:hypothetical protein HanLR1_Chr11g0425121 [Helianthus annuus]|nr:hypothetical protein HanHA89_Chr11g0447811 [Helianthus annuus]KAJ0687355.1 hypothetical protein HanLR1_Chr11g0425121 [Helianthus annuus]